jgi:hypothetical protein
LRLHELLFTECAPSPTMNFSGDRNPAQARHGPPDARSGGTASPPGTVLDRSAGHDSSSSALSDRGGLSVHV